MWFSHPITIFTKVAQTCWTGLNIRRPCSTIHTTRILSFKKIIESLCLVWPQIIVLKDAVWIANLPEKTYMRCKNVTLYTPVPSQYSHWRLSVVFYCPQYCSPKQEFQDLLRYALSRWILTEGLFEYLILTYEWRGHGFITAKSKMQVFIWLHERQLLFDMWMLWPNSGIEMIFLRYLCVPNFIAMIFFGYRWLSDRNCRNYCTWAFIREYMWSKKKLN